MRYDAQFLWIKFDFLELFVPIQKQEWTGGGAFRTKCACDWGFSPFLKLIFAEYLVLHLFLHRTPHWLKFLRRLFDFTFIPSIRLNTLKYITLIQEWLVCINKC